MQYSVDGDLMFLPDLKAALSNIYRSLMEGGHFAAAVWALPHQDTLIVTTMNTVMKETNIKRLRRLRVDRYILLLLLLLSLYILNFQLNTL